MNPDDILNQLCEVLKIEANAIQTLTQRVLDQALVALEILYGCKGKVVVTGMGKPGFIARKISATMNSTGTVSVFMHPAEALHGDLGVISENDVVIAISNSGETDEILNLISFLKAKNIPLISMTGNVTSTLARFSSVVLDVSIEKEACPIGLAPTASTTAALAMGDAISMVLMKMKNIKSEDFAKHHPGGSLGKKLLLKVQDLMRTGSQHPIVNENELMSQVLLQITKAHAGAATIINQEGKLVGIFTDGDLRRLFQTNQDIYRTPIQHLMSANPLYVYTDTMAIEALTVMTEKQIDELVVVDFNLKPVGLLDVQDLIKEGLV